MRQSDFEALNRRYLSAEFARESLAEELERLENAVISWVDELGELANGYDGPFLTATDRLVKIGLMLREDRRFFAPSPDGAPQDATEQHDTRTRDGAPQE